MILHLLFLHPAGMYCIALSQRKRVTVASFSGSPSIIETVGSSFGYFVIICHVFDRPHVVQSPLSFDVHRRIFLLRTFQRT